MACSFVGFSCHIPDNGYRNAIAFLFCSAYYGGFFDCFFGEIISRLAKLNKKQVTAFGGDLQEGSINN